MDVLNWSAVSKLNSYQFSDMDVVMIHVLVVTIVFAGMAIIYEGVNKGKK